MSLSLEGLKVGLSYPNVRAFLRVIRERESGQGDDAYLMVNGGGRMEGFARHPWHGIPTTRGAKACGAYQFLGTTWAGLCDQYEFPDMSPESQDLGAIALIKERGALSDVIAGRIEEAIAKLRPVWTSLPGASESSHSWTMDKAMAVYTGAGGTIDNAELLTPVEDRALTEVTPSTGRAPQPESPKESPMPIPAIVLGLIQAAASVLPVIAQIKGDKSQSSATQNVAVAGKILDVVATTVGAVNQQQAVEIVQQDPAARQKADEAIRAQFFDLLKYAQEQETIAWERTEKSVGDARSFAEKMLGKEGWQSIGFGALIGVLAILIIVGAGWMLWRLAELATTDQTTRGLIVGAAIAMLGQVVSYFFGSSSSSRQSGEALRNIAQGKGAGQ
jgi:lysozyme